MKQKIQIVLVLVMIVAGIRLAWIFYERQQAAVQSSHKEAPLLNPDYYVTPKKLYPYDLKSAKQLTKQPVWVKIGYAYSYYPYNSAAHRARFVERSWKTLALTETRDQGCNCRIYAGEGRAASPGGISAGRKIICCTDWNREQW